MYLNLFSIFIILSYQCLLICANSTATDILIRQVENRAPNESNALKKCKLRVPPRTDINKYPTPYVPNLKAFGDYLYVEPQQLVKLSCPEGLYVSISYENEREIMVKCLEGNFLEYDLRPYHFLSVRCVPLPEPDKEPDLDAWKKYPEDKFHEAKSPNDCFLPVTKTDFRLPIPFTVNYRPSILVPDHLGYLYIKHNTSFKVTCSITRFQMASIRYELELLLTCIQHNFILFNQSVYKYSDFRCTHVPKSKLVLSNFKCQNNKYSLAAVGFQVVKKFLVVYNICYDTLTRSNIYSWYRNRAPYLNVDQRASETGPYIKTKQLLGSTDVTSLYGQQVSILQKILKSKELVQNYIYLKNNRYLTRGQLTSKNEFFYSFQQKATHYFENTAPVWQIFYTEVWLLVDKYLRVKLAEEPKSNHLIISGTYGTCMLPDIDSVEQPLYLAQRPPGLPVPRFIWKMDYDIDMKEGIVFVGLNDPYGKVNQSTYICETQPCPESFRTALEMRKRFEGIVYCCSTASFVMTYGHMDPLKWKNNII